MVAPSRWWRGAFPANRPGMERSANSARTTGERPGEELLLGVVGRFWRPTGDLVHLTADEVRAFDRPGYAVGAWDFTLAEEGDAVRLATETRVRCTDEASRRSFRRYWTVVGPFSALIRREMLRSIRRAAESASSEPKRPPHA